MNNTSFSGIEKLDMRGLDFYKKVNEINQEWSNLEEYEKKIDSLISFYGQEGKPVEKVVEELEGERVILQLAKQIHGLLGQVANKRLTEGLEDDYLKNIDKTFVSGFYKEGELEEMGLPKNASPFDIMRIRINLMKLSCHGFENLRILKSILGVMSDENNSYIEPTQERWEKCEKLLRLTNKIQDQCKEILLAVKKEVDAGSEKIPRAYIQKITANIGVIDGMTDPIFKVSPLSLPEYVDNLLPIIEDWASLVLPNEMKILTKLAGLG